MGKAEFSQGLASSFSINGDIGANDIRGQITAFVAADPGGSKHVNDSAIGSSNNCDNRYDYLGLSSNI